MDEQRAICKHHWVIEEARGPRSQGECKFCGETRVFRNWFPELDFLTNTDRRFAYGS